MPNRKPYWKSNGLHGGNYIHRRWTTTWTTLFWSQPSASNPDRLGLPRTTQPLLDRPHVQLEQGLKGWQPPWHETHPNMFATFPTAWPGLPKVLLQEQRHSSHWPRPPKNAWLYAGVVTNAAHLKALTTYASTYAVPILAIVGRALLSAEHRANCVEWPLPLDPDKPSSCTSADHMRRTGLQDVLRQTCAY